MKKSLTSEMLIFIDMCSSKRLRRKSVTVRPATIISSPASTSQMKPISLSLMPLSTIDWVRNGMMSCSAHAMTSVAAITAKLLRWRFRYPARKRNECGDGRGDGFTSGKPSCGLRNSAMPTGSSLSLLAAH